ncbi:hypothetical protein RQ831_16155 [Roseomonas gilardii]|uniref:Uncharacterized protein n=1 Tax=Roseomonas gilardii TaxID=257708 RepID=A0ABU3MJF6_9PROT|nr:hypothetical protein [Roseomonas gilardii]MDT8332591.1 hypothetical protein [Roseomonas gilardii]
MTPSQLKKMSRVRQVAYLTYWFNEMFVDPAEETPYESREGGYQYIFGGPYDARDELDDQFSHLVTEGVISLAVEEVENTGIIEWAPSRRHPDQIRNLEDVQREDEEREERKALDDILNELQAGFVPVFGDAREQVLRSSLLDAVANLLQALPPKPQDAVSIGIGHNGAPAEPNEQPVEAVREAATAVKDALSKPEPDALSVARNLSGLRTAAIWLGKKLDKGADKLAESLADQAAKPINWWLVNHLTQGQASKIAADIGQLLERGQAWLHHLVSFMGS